MARDDDNTPDDPGEVASPERAPRLLNQVLLFQYVTVDLTPTYRAIVQVFFEAKQHYVIELRPGDVLERLRQGGYQVDVRSEEELESRLKQLVDWQNLLRAYDNTTASRTEDFYRKRFIYHLTGPGEAAHRAVLEVEATVGKSGALQASMLVKIRDALQRLVSAGAGSLEPHLLFSALHDLYSAFDTLTEEATRFIGELNRHLGAERMEEERFVLHKQAVLAYISRFVDQLRQVAPDITAAVEEVSRIGIRRVVTAAASAAELPPPIREQDPVAIWIREETEKWSGVVNWFSRAGTTAMPTLERLAEVAVDAVVRLTRTLGRLNERRTRPVDRAADFRTLARWFSSCATDGEAHCLWQTAFGLYSARHFHLAEDDADATSPSSSWWQARPVEVPIRLRTRGRTSEAGRPSAAADHTMNKEWIAQRRRQERAQLESAMRRFVGHGDLRFSDIATLDAVEFDLLLSLLDQALSAPRAQDRTRSARTADGRLVVSLHAAEPGNQTWVTLRTPRGELRCRNYRITVSDVRRGRAPAGAESASGSGEGS